MLKENDTQYFNPVQKSNFQDFLCSMKFFFAILKIQIPQLL